MERQCAVRSPYYRHNGLAVNILRSVDPSWTPHTANQFIHEAPADEVSAYLETIQWSRVFYEMLMPYQSRDVIYDFLVSRHADLSKEQLARLLSRSIKARLPDRVDALLPFVPHSKRGRIAGIVCREAQKGTSKHPDYLPLRTRVVDTLKA